MVPATGTKLNSPHLRSVSHDPCLSILFSIGLACTVSASVRDEPLSSYVCDVSFHIELSVTFWLVERCFQLKGNL